MKKRDTYAEIYRDSNDKVSAEYTIIVKGLRKSYKNQTVLDGLDFTVKKGTIFALLGPNGAGKTTTIRILCTLLLPDSGQVVINGYNVVKEADKVRRFIGLTGQYAALDEYLTGKENLEMIGRLYHLRHSEIKQRTNELLEQFDLTEASNRIVKTYSGGMRRRLDLAVSLIASPPVIFLDEPTTGLDPRSRLILWDIVKRIASSGTTILLTTQDMDEADHLADRLIVIDGGRIIAEGTSDELKSRVGSERLEITIAQTSKLEDAKEVLGGNGIHLDSERRLLSMKAKDGVQQLKQVLNFLEEVGIGVENVSFHRPTLDDVFLTLTGHSVEQQQTLSIKKSKQQEV